MKKIRTKIQTILKDDSGFIWLVVVLGCIGSCTLLALSASN